MVLIVVFGVVLVVRVIGGGGARSPVASDSCLSPTGSRVSCLLWSTRESCGSGDDDDDWCAQQGIMICPLGAVSH